MKASTKKWHVEADTAAQYFGPRTYRHWEDGFVYQDWPEGHVVNLWNDYGNEYVHPHSFDTAEEAERFAAKVRAHLEAGGQPNLEHWRFIRVRYGTQAYLNEEPYIVERERHDAIYGLDVHGYNDIPIGGYRHDE